MQEEASLPSGCQQAPGTQLSSQPWLHPEGHLEEHPGPISILLFYYYYRFHSVETSGIATCSNSKARQSNGSTDTGKTQACVWGARFPPLIVSESTHLILAAAAGLKDLRR